jgi:hypothetical protein
MVVSFNKVVAASMCVVEDKELKKEIVKKRSQE